MELQFPEDENVTRYVPAPGVIVILGTRTYVVLVVATRLAAMYVIIAKPAFPAHINAVGVRATVGANLLV